ncbi:hypothetical protein ScPMuIL_009465 [Solemya velum]
MIFKIHEVTSRDKVYWFNFRGRSIIIIVHLRTALRRYCVKYELVQATRKWIPLSALAEVILTGLVHGQFPSDCLKTFDTNFRKCFQDNGGQKLETIFSLVTNGSSGPLPDEVAKNPGDLVKSVCSQSETLNGCITPVPDNVGVQCNQQEQGMMRSTIDSMSRALVGMCGGGAAQPPACLKKFDNNFRSCLTKIGIVPDNFFMLVANQTLPPGANSEMLKNVTCSQPKQQNILNCASNAMGQLTQECGQQEQMMVGATLQNLMGAYQAMCVGGSPGMSVSPCLKQFEANLEECSAQTMNVDMKNMVVLLAHGELPPDVDVDAMNVSICGKWHDFESCGKEAVKKSACTQRDLLMVEATFANMMISIAAFCHDDSLPGACMLTLQNQFEKCFGEVDLDPKLYFNNSTNQRGAILGNTKPLAQNYCAKRHDLYTCMRKVMHQCPGAEETLTLTGFDLTAMERALGILCADIPEYLEGLSCFEKPTQASRQCMDQMTQGITNLSTKQITQKLSMTSFFDDFCRVRVRHVGCDAQAWPSCDQNAVQLKNKFECHLLPDRCHDVNEDDIRRICPQAKPRTGAQCADHVKENIEKCFSRYNVDSSMFLVNITHDRRSVLGDANAARQFCGSRAKVFACMKGILNGCSGAEDKLAYWGHQQSSLISAINVLCNDLNTYQKGFSCLNNPNNQVQQCVSETTNRMAVLSGRSVTKELSPSDYYNDFCSIRVDHLKCDLQAWQPECDIDVIGMKTEFECKLMQDRCNTLERSTLAQVCNNQMYAKSARRRNGGTTGASGVNGATSVSSVASSAIILFVFVTFALV